MNYIIVTYCCHECGAEFDVRVWPLIRGRSTGHPDTWTDDEGGEIEPEVCATCGEGVCDKEVQKLVEGEQE